MEPELGGKSKFDFDFTSVTVDASIKDMLRKLEAPREVGCVLHKFETRGGKNDRRGPSTALLAEIDAEDWKRFVEDSVTHLVRGRKNALGIVNGTLVYGIPGDSWKAYEDNEDGWKDYEVCEDDEDGEDSGDDEEEVQDLRCTREKYQFPVHEEDKTDRNCFVKQLVRYWKCTEKLCKYYHRRWPCLHPQPEDDPKRRPLDLETLQDWSAIIATGNTGIYQFPTERLQLPRFGMSRKKFRLLRTEEAL
jgi:hypothetical protein